MLSELKRRNVIRVAFAYLAGSWLLIQIADVLVPVYELPESAIQILTNVLAIGLVPVLVLSWVFEWTPDGLKRDVDLDPDAPQGAKTLDRIIMIVLALAVGLFAFDKFVLDPARDAELAEQVRAETRVESYGERSIAVLPFVNMSSDADQVFFSDGISEEILNLLAKIQQLRVTSRSTAFSYRGDVNIPEVAAALNVTYILEGSVRQAGDTVRVTAQLIDARTDTHLWSETWDRGAADIFAIQDEVAQEVADELRVRLVNDRRSTQETDLETYSMYLQAKHVFYGRAADVNDLSEPMRLLREVLDRDPDFVPAMTLLVLINGYELQNRGLGDAERRALVEESDALALRAYELDPEDGVANLRKAWVSHARQGDIKNAMPYAERALALEPNNVEVLRMLSFVAWQYGRFDDAVLLGERAMRIDPLCIVCVPPLASAYSATGRWDLVEALQRKRVEAINDRGGRFNLADALLMQGRAEEALPLFESVDVGSPPWYSTTAMALHELGRTNEALARIDELQEKHGERATLYLASFHGFVGNADETLFWFKKFMEQSPETFHFLVWDENLEILHDTPEWQQWRVANGLDEASLAKFQMTIPDFGD